MYVFNLQLPINPTIFRVARHSNSTPYPKRDNSRDLVDQNDRLVWHAQWCALQGSQLLLLRACVRSLRCKRWPQGKLTPIRTGHSDGANALGVFSCCSYRSGPLYCIALKSDSFCVYTWRFENMRINLIGTVVVNWNWGMRLLTYIRPIFYIIRPWINSVLLSDLIGKCSCATHALEFIL